MIKFHDLLQAPRGVSVGEQQKSARRSFPLLVDKSRFKLWAPGQLIASQGTRLLIGVATYSGADLKLLDLLGEALERNGQEAPSINVFDTLDCTTHDDFDKYIPGMGKVFQTPVVGVWRNGALNEKASGKSARDLIGLVCNLNPSSLQALWS
jgi:hypothetical protein